MTVYKRMYLRLFNAITAVIELLEENNSGDAIELLVAAQQEVEELFISSNNSL